jgi:hypothetical protein
MTIIAPIAHASRGRLKKPSPRSRRDTVATLTPLSIEIVQLFPPSVSRVMGRAAPHKVSQPRPRLLPLEHLQAHSLSSSAQADDPVLAGLRDPRHSIHAVIAGLDPAIHRASHKSLQRMMTRRGPRVIHARAHHHPRTAHPANVIPPSTHQSLSATIRRTPLPSPTAATQAPVTERPIALPPVQMGSPPCHHSSLPVPRPGSRPTPAS